MKTLYLDCSMGAAGDMLTAALLELCPEPEKFVERLNKIGIPGVTYQAEKAVKCGITGTHMTVKVKGQTEESVDYHAEESDVAKVHHHHGEADEEVYHNHAEEIHEAKGHNHHEEACHCHAEESDIIMEHKHHEEIHDAGESHATPHHHHGEQENHHTEENHAAHHHHHEHHNMQNIRDIVSGLDLSEDVRRDVLNVYELIAQAESHVHDRPVDEIHFHEVGTMDAVADVTAVCLLMRELNVERVVASKVHVGSGQVHCAHGILPVPAPATAWLLRDIPTYGGQIRGELCTPTGAALLKYFVDEFKSQPPMKVQRIGYGCGQKDFEMANCVRAMIGETEEKSEDVLELCCNLDDMTPEAIGFAMDELFAAGALDVYTTPAGMKKNRPGVLLTCLCRIEQREEIVRLLFLHTTTLGVREKVCSRYTLERSTNNVHTEYGTVRVKNVTGWGVSRKKPEYDDIAKIAREQKISLAQAEELLGE